MKEFKLLELKETEKGKLFIDNYNIKNRQLLKQIKNLSATEIAHKMGKIYNKQDMLYILSQHIEHLETKLKVLYDFSICYKDIEQKKYGDFKLVSMKAVCKDILKCKDVNFIKTTSPYVGKQWEVNIYIKEIDLTIYLLQSSGNNILRCSDCYINNVLYDHDSDNENSIVTALFVALLENMAKKEKEEFEKSHADIYEMVTDIRVMMMNSHGTDCESISNMMLWEVSDIEQIHNEFVQFTRMKHDYKTRINKYISNAKK